LLLACHSRLSLDFFDSGLHTCTAVARLTLALAKLSCPIGEKTAFNGYRYIAVYADHENKEKMEE